MRDIATKVNVTTTLDAGDFNALNNELENVVTSSDQTLNSAGGPDTNLNMLSQAISGYANAGSTYNDSGTANSYVLSIASNLKSPTKYYDKMTIIFKVGNTNTGGSTINVSSLGSQSFTTSSGVALAAGSVNANQYITAVYNLSNTRFELVVLPTVINNDIAYNNLISDQRTTGLSLFDSLTSGLNFATDRYGTSSFIDLVNSLNVLYEKTNKRVRNDGVGGFAAVTYAGSASEVIVTTGFQTSLVWAKSRSNILQHYLFDIIRGTNTWIRPNTTTISTTAANSMTAFGSTSFTAGTDTNFINSVGQNFASWVWECNTDVTESTAGTINPVTEKINAVTGMSMIQFEGTGATATYGHNLQDENGARAPQLIITKPMDAAIDWRVYHHKLNTEKLPGADPQDASLKFSTTEPIANEIDVWNDTAPTTALVSLGSSTGTNNASTMIAYLFCEIEGYSKFGTYEGTSHGDTIISNLGFKPQMLIIRNADAVSDWVIFDTSMGKTTGGGNIFLSVNETNVEDATGVNVSLTDDGFILHNLVNFSNTIDQTFVYIAFGSKGVGTNLDLISNDLITGLTARPTNLNVNAFVDDVGGTTVFGTDVKVFGSGRTGSATQPTSNTAFWTELTITDQGKIKNNIHHIVANGDITTQPDDAGSTEIRYRIKTFNAKTIYISGVELEITP